MQHHTMSAAHDDDRSATFDDDLPCKVKSGPLFNVVGNLMASHSAHAASKALAP